MSAANPVRRRAAALAAAGAAVLLLQLAAVPASAKVFLEARLDAPISFQSPPGEPLLVGVTLTVPDGLEDYAAIDASPVWLILHGRDGDTSQAQGALDGGPGHYAFRIEVPAGGPRTLELMLGEGSDMPVFLMTDPFTFRAIGEDTAQLAVPPAPVVPAAPVELPAAAPSAVAPAPAMLALALVGMGLVAAAVGLLLARSGRRARSVDVPPQAPGA